MQNISQTAAVPYDPRGGTPWYNDASSAIGAPTFGLPLLGVEGVPLGIQIKGFEGEDEDLAAIAHALLGAFAPRAIRGGVEHYCT